MHYYGMSVVCIINSTPPLPQLRGEIRDGRYRERVPAADPTYLPSFELGDDAPFREPTPPSLSQNGPVRPVRTSGETPSLFRLQADVLLVSFQGNHDNPPFFHPAPVFNMTVETE